MTMNTPNDSSVSEPIKSTARIPTTTSKKLPDNFSISVIMESRPSQSQWVDEVWDAVGIVALSNEDAGDVDGNKTENETNKEVKVIEQNGLKQLIYSGLKIRLFLDECESYYHNLMSPEPGCFIVAREEDEEGEPTDKPIPVMVTLSFDEAHAYLEGDDTVYAVPIPSELYQWVEAYILENYEAEKRIKRKRKNWKKGE